MDEPLFPGDPAARPRLQALLSAWHVRLQALFVERQGAMRRRRSLLQRRLLLGLELLCKVEEQVLLPALTDAVPAWVPAADLSRHEIGLLRDVSVLASRTAAANREVSLSVLEGLAAVHFARVEDLLQQPGGEPVPWAALEREIRGLLGRWHAEVLQTGEVEDEDRDPVGQPPR